MKKPSAWAWWGWEPDYFYRRTGRVGLSEASLAKWYDSIHSERVVAEMAEAGIDCAITHFFKGFGMEFERQGMAQTAELVNICRKYGIQVFGYIQYGSLFHETLFKEEPSAQSWIQVDEAGKPQTWFDDSFRYLPCANQCGHLEYLKKVICKGIKETGLDGLHFDNFYSRPCYCEACREEFKKYIETRHPEMNNLLPSEAKLNEPNITDEQVVAWIEFRQKAMLRVMRELKDHAKSLKPDIMLLYNPSFIRGLQNQAVLRSTDMFKIGSEAEYLWAEGGNLPGIRRHCLVHQVNYFKTAEAAGYKALSTTWKHDSEGSGLGCLPEEVKLNTAESAAYGAVPGANWLLRPTESGGLLFENMAESTAALKQYLAFLKRYEGIFRSSRFVAKVAFFLNKDARIASFADSYGNYLVALQTMLHNHIPFDVIFSEQSNRLKNYSLLILTGQTYSKEELEILAQFTSAGGKLLLVGQHSEVERLDNVQCYCPETDWMDCVDSGYCTYVRQPTDAAQFVLKVKQQCGYEPAFEFCGPDYVFVEPRQTAAGDLALHMINYNNKEKVRNMCIRIKTQVSEAELITPDGANPVQIIGRQDDDSMYLEVPELATYSILLLKKEN